MPIRRAMELRVKTLVLNALGVLFGLGSSNELSSIPYDLRELAALGVSIMTHRGLRPVHSVARLPQKAGCFRTQLLVRKRAA
jgi:hypothetical protein